ncbi:DUF4230 domain-containing protein [Sulfuriroseicoccus oceanibius]|uniref:DUF4230 domain-containing protein n=1 Tax=Sulfuriroseicoccus oceanibius TaxID=2707525 RepID=A0A6B3LEP7_9BACT|nr:DUF4230 domain-containing protein [Sulfuriroseicoccus oceanibius]QQL45410.1 DUF4230 domain-containing protein [Sulfuriroseicoccus oceanibius]
MSKTHSLKPWIGACLLAAVLGAIAWFLIYEGPAKQAERIAKAAANVLGLTPTVVEENTIVLEPSKEITELALASKKFTQSYHFKHTWMGSTKELEVEAVFTAKAGYVLDSPLQLMLPDNGQPLTATLSDPVILSNEPSDMRIIEDENGFWNRLNNEDRNRAMKELKKRADATALNSGLLEEADRNLIEQLRNAIEPVIDRTRRTPIEVRRVAH